jgi:hypothetical protein
VNRARWAGAAGALVLGIGGVACAALGDLGSYTDCSGKCDASVTPGDDASSVDDASQPPPNDDGQVSDEAGPGADDASDHEDASENPDVTTTTTSDSGGGGVEATAPMDAATQAEAGPAHDSGTTTTGDSGTATGDGGCASTGTPQNCSACGVACDTSTGTPKCNGVTCSYTCDTNRIDCNSITAPDTDGCECAGTACCGPNCETAHESGIPNPATYYNCSATGNSTLIEATAVCLGVGGGDCLAQTVNCPIIAPTTPTSAVCGMVSTTCYCWVYSGMGSGTVSTPSFGCAPLCQSGQSWN